MDPDVRPSRLPGALLITAVGVIGVCGLPSALFFAMLAVNAESIHPYVLVLGLPALIAYPLAVWLWVRARRARSTGRAWTAAALGMALVVGSSVVPVTILGGALITQWKETQPGGRGYVPPER
ncbi:hypothetical protein [Actinoplanes xinjiangensis]|uniref:hypothetical protein n=1 Tax=Actinoplanes xinjiangensis TaxID=512350 RepID=UPI000D6D9EA0|nr:hypothetical protein [Actinoplanes xinjiangensis]GIF39654.1 hypothetical protein Axi01nite_39650 [Actinoplanes xinjiangensis]